MSLGYIGMNRDMEWSQGGHFKDSQSLIFLTRKLPVPSFKVVKTDSLLVITTEKWSLKYKVGSGKFTNANFQIAFN